MRMLQQQHVALLLALQARFTSKQELKVALPLRKVLFWERLLRLLMGHTLILSLDLVRRCTALPLPLLPTVSAIHNGPVSLTTAACNSGVRVIVPNCLTRAMLTIGYLHRRPTLKRRTGRCLKNFVGR